MRLPLIAAALAVLAACASGTVDCSPCPGPTLDLAGIGPAGAYRICVDRRCWDAPGETAGPNLALGGVVRAGQHIRTMTVTATVAGSAPREFRAGPEGIRIPPDPDEPPDTCWCTMPLVGLDPTGTLTLTDKNAY